MRLVTVRVLDGTHAGRLDGDDVVLLPYHSVSELLDDPDWFSAADANQHERVAYDPANLAPAVPAPGKFLAVGFNFPAHLSEADAPAQPEWPSLFCKFARCLIGPRDPVALPHPQESVQIDWEVELAVVVGRPLRRATARQAQAAIAGYTVTNDVSVRDRQFRSRQATAGKAWEGTTPIGPAVVTPDEIDAVSELVLSCTIDGALMQQGSAGDMIFQPAEILSYVSTFVTLDPGDVVSLGTPAGSALGQTPPPWLRDGQLIETEISGLGQLLNRCAAPSDLPPPEPESWRFR